MPRTQASIHSPGLAIDIAAFITTKEQRNPSNLVRMAATSERVELAYLLRCTA